MDMHYPHSQWGRLIYTLNLRLRNKRERENWSWQMKPESNNLCTNDQELGNMYIYTLDCTQSSHAHTSSSKHPSKVSHNWYYVIAIRLQAAQQEAEMSFKDISLVDGKKKYSTVQRLKARQPPSNCHPKNKSTQLTRVERAKKEVLESFDGAGLDSLSTKESRYMTTWLYMYIMCTIIMNIWAHSVQHNVLHYLMTVVSHMSIYTIRIHKSWKTGFDYASHFFSLVFYYLQWVNSVRCIRHNYYVHQV